MTNNTKTDVIFTGAWCNEIIVNTRAAILKPQHIKNKWIKIYPTTATIN